jgi:hypothetical protein
MAFGQPRALTRGTEGRVPGDLPHCYSCALAAWNQGEMDGFLQGEHALRYSPDGTRYVDVCDTRSGGRLS